MKNKFRPQQTLGRAAGRPAKRTCLADARTPDSTDVPKRLVNWSPRRDISRVHRCILCYTAVYGDLWPPSPFYLGARRCAQVCIYAPCTRMRYEIYRVNGKKRVLVDTTRRNTKKSLNEDGSRNEQLQSYKRFFVSVEM